MTPGSTVQSTFVGGEISPSIFGRTDLERFSTSASELENFQPTMEGPITRRVGTRVRGFAEGVEVGPGRLLAFSSGSFSAALLFRNLKVSVTPLDPTFVTDFVDVVTPYLLEEVAEIQVCQVNDVLFLTHPLHPPARLARYAAGSWTYEVLPLESGPYLDYRSEDAGVSLKISNFVDRIRISSTFANEWSAASANPLEDYPLIAVEYNSTSARALGRVVTKFANNDLDIEPLEERCYKLDKEVTAIGRFTGYGAGGQAPYNLATAANYFPLVSAPDNRLVAGNFYVIETKGTTTWTTYGAPAGADVGTSFYSTTTVDPIPNGGKVLNENIGFSHQFAITTDIIGNYLRYLDESGTCRWMKVFKRGDVPAQSSYGIIAKGHTVYLAVAGATSYDSAPNTGTITQGPRRITATITASTPAFTASDLGRWLRLEFGQTIVDVKITEVTSSTVVQVSLLRGVPFSGEGSTRKMDSTTTVWRRGSFYPGNYPRCVSFFEQRLCFAATPAEPQTIWLSKVADYYNFAPTNTDSLVEDDSSINITLATDVFQDIRWMANRSVLIVGTSNAEWSITAGQNRDALTPKTVTARRESSYGSALVQGIQSGRSVLFIQNGGIRVRELTYDYAVDAHVPVDVTVFAAHLLPTQLGATELHYVRQPDPMLIAVTGSGQIAAMVYEPDQKVYAWARFKLGGPGDPKIVSACVTQGIGADTLWVLVVRDGIYTVEQAFPAYRPSSKEDVSTIHYFLDSAIELPVFDPPVSEYDLAEHARFTDASVSVLIDDQLYPAVPVVGTMLTLPKAPATRLWVGFSSVARFISYPVVPSSKVGPSPGRAMCVSKITLRVKDTLDFHYGIDGVELQEFKARKFSDPVTLTPYLRSEDITLSPPRKFDTFLRWAVESRNPYPITVQMAVVEMTQTN